MEQIMQDLEAKKSWKDSMRKCCRNNKLNIDLASVYTPLRFRSAYARFKAIYQKRDEEKVERWLQNELKAFEWLTVALSCILDIKIKEFSSSQISRLADVFQFKQLLTLQYEVRKLSEDPTERTSWDFQQQSILTNIILTNDDTHNKWNQYARKLFQSSGKKFFRTGKQCRERWMNHLDPLKKHGEWTNEEDLTLVNLFLSDGKKWSQISKKLGGSRTEHMVKNRHKTIISRQKKIYPSLNSETSLLKSFLYPDMYGRKETEKEIIQENISIQSVKAEDKSQDAVKRKQIEEQIQVQNEKDDVERIPQDTNKQVIQKKEEKEDRIMVQQFLRVEMQRHDNKNIPQTSAAYQIPQVYSPWMINYQMTPPFSPFFMSMPPPPTFSSFDASFNSQFYCPTRNFINDRTDQL